ncbi:hypothetical protein Q5P01_003155 [Channa striata]|uniref:Cadherin domain-containing protein n=1 Tax=Channa striata TaxID=64152 RepID=A0AA88NRT2_CHASR|nr:hypothetical protein Q5P01_003155 [Channa striata]
MGVARFAVFSLLLVTFQASAVGTAEEATCVSGFVSDLLIFRVTRKHLRPGTELGKVGFTDCTERTRFLFNSDDNRFMVQTDGTLKVKRAVVLHEGRRDFSIHSWDSQGRKMTVPVRILYHNPQEDYHQNVEPHIHQQHLLAVDSINYPESADDPEVPVLRFPKSSGGLKRKKRDYVIPSLNIVENSRGPFPQVISQIRSSAEELKKIIYSITGPGADQPPVGLFTMDRSTGFLYVTQPLDREKQAKYTFQIQAVGDDGEKGDEPINVVIHVLDQNDNEPVFAFVGDIPETSPIGFEVTTVRDEAGTNSSDVRHTILSQDPHSPSDSRFAIQPVTGVVRVTADGLGRKKCSEYTLTVRPAHMEGGLREQAKVISVRESNKDGPEHTQAASADDPEVPVLRFPKSTGDMKRKKRQWVIPPLNIGENTRGPFPQRISQIRSSAEELKKIIYSITGPGADQPPVGLFTMDRSTGILYVTQPLDREKQAKYIFQAHAVAEGAENPEAPMEIIVNVVDQNDNKPKFSQDTYMGDVAEASPIGFKVITVVATDDDEPGTDNSDLRYSIVSQDPQLPSGSLFSIDPVTGVIRVNALGLDREKYPKYTLLVQAADMMGEGLNGQAKVILTVTDGNDNVNCHIQPTYEASVDENKVDAVVARMFVTDADEAHTPAWNAKFRIVAGDTGGLFNVTTGSNKQEGIITTTKGLDFEESSRHVLLVAVENEDPFATPLPTATATVTVNVLDVNEPPVVDPALK